MKGESSVPLTVKDILEKTFKRSFKGYDEDEVDKFLDQIIDEFKALQAEIASLKDGVAQAREQISAAKEQAGKVKHTEETIMKTLVSAQKTSERLIGEATRKAELIISSAESTAKNRVSQTTRELAEAQARLDELKGCAQGFAANFANMVNAQAAYFEKTYRSYFGQDTAPLGGINTDALEKIDRDIAQTLQEINALPDASGAAGDVYAEGPVEGPEPPVAQPEGAPPAAQREGMSEDGYMELYEINKALSELENSAFGDGEAAASGQGRTPGAGMSAINDVYGDFSWLYETGEKPEEPGTGLKDPKEQEELKSLIDEILE